MFRRLVIATLLVIAAAVAALTLTGCIDNKANVVSHNISQAADNFEVSRRIIFYNGITGNYILVIEGLCSLGNYDKAREISITCKVGPTTYKKHFLGLSDNVTFLAEQIEPAAASTYHYRVVFKPSTIIPDVEIQ